MAKHRAISKDYMIVGEVAKKIGVTVRTLQYYDKEGLLSPSAESEGGRRLYTDKDLVILHQIISLKSLGFSLDDIKHRLISLETPTDVANALTEQADSIREKIEQLTASLAAIEQLKAEVLQMQTVNFKKYADIIDEILRTLIEKGKGLELNTAGLKYGLPFAHPHADVLKRYRELGGEIITIGADGHRPEHIAYDFSKVRDILEDCGFKYYTEFKGRKPYFCQLL